MNEIYDDKGEMIPQEKDRDEDVRNRLHFAVK